MEADLALARGRVIHGRFLEQRAEDPEQAREDPRELALFERAASLYRARGDVRGEGEALFWVGCCHQVVRRDNEAAVPVLWRSLELATEADDPVTMSEALRHLGIAEHAAGRLDAARLHLEESTRLRREIGAWPGVASNLVGLIYIAAGQDRREDGLALAEEARRSPRRTARRACCARSTRPARSCRPRDLVCRVRWPSCAGSGRTGCAGSGRRCAGSSRRCAGSGRRGRPWRGRRSWPAAPSRRGWRKRRCRRCRPRR